MNVVVFAHTPPPFHGQSYMVQMLLDGFRDRRIRSGRRPAEDNDGGEIRLYHVNARFSSSLEHVGTPQAAKLFRLIGYCLRAIWCRFRYCADTLYYVPAPPKPVALLRDWLVMLLCRPFFRFVVLHWHAAGLMQWVSRRALARAITMALLGRPSVSIVLSTATIDDGVLLGSRLVKVVHNGMPDPCPEFERDVLPQRLARLEHRRKALANNSSAEATFRVLFLGNCIREKGIFDTILAVQIVACQLAAARSCLQISLTVAGSFVSPGDQKQFDSLAADAPCPLKWVGFAGEAAKDELLRTSDCLCFPTYYSAEAQPMSIVEAMAYGLNVVTTKWRGIPEMLPPGSSFVRACDCEAIADALLTSATSDDFLRLRARFEADFTRQAFLAGMEEAMASITHNNAG